MSTLHRRMAAPTFLLRRYCRIADPARKLLRCKRVMLRQRRTGFARQSVPVLSEQIGSRTRSVAE
ncbi:MAG: hypothetical protein A2W31_08460 [Planctomycetes bacterium RBG_16_64_10]|nr:MAG: hypothetical protein A2W31_08460 [Planctomycetes bacterium RBG_16_64_10]